MADLDKVIKGLEHCANEECRVGELQIETRDEQEGAE